MKVIEAVENKVEEFVANIQLFSSKNDIEEVKLLLSFVPDNKWVTVRGDYHPETKILDRPRVYTLDSEKKYQEALRRGDVKCFVPASQYKELNLC